MSSFILDVKLVALDLFAPFQVLLVRIAGDALPPLVEAFVGAAAELGIGMGTGDGDGAGAGVVAVSAICDHRLWILENSDMVGTGLLFDKQC
eukprot:CAMPEP_0184697452 /NCGR_PEP_ID=MMETSP0313-20130426/4424_1 /TAXON_ID=2792 /ORGANISM="Porphyridium aerugineum, Strain SAG 1380-2" /LENGTH=91 /DNA_ID=CAMNT_0027156259 /DNA_START=194 /DNA_END=469 /DNA_ORIENTATION=-